MFKIVVMVVCERGFKVVMVAAYAGFGLKVVMVVCERGFKVVLVLVTWF